MLSSCYHKLQVYVKHGLSNRRISDKILVWMSGGSPRPRCPALPWSVTINLLLTYRSEGTQLLSGETFDFSKPPFQTRMYFSLVSCQRYG